MGQHWIEIIAETEDSDADYSLECESVDLACRLWTECLDCSPTEDQLEEGEWESHGKAHQLIDDLPMIGTERCIVLVLAPQGDGPNQILFHGGADYSSMPAGRYPIDFVYEGDGYVQVTLQQSKAA